MSAAGARSICPVPFPHASLQCTHQPPLLLLITQRDALEAGVDDAGDAQLDVSEQRTALY